jgi:hypothetical protein
LAAKERQPADIGLARTDLRNRGYHVLALRPRSERFSIVTKHLDTRKVLRHIIGEDCTLLSNKAHGVCTKQMAKLVTHIR